MSNPTALKFGYPHTLVAECEHRWILARPRQVTLGSLMLACKQAVSVEGFDKLQTVIAGAKRVLKDLVSAERVDDPMLMMVDPDVHFHVTPRDATSRSFAGLTRPDLAVATVPAALTTALKARRLAAG